MFSGAWSVRVVAVDGQSCCSLVFVGEKTVVFGYERHISKKDVRIHCKHMLAKVAGGRRSEEFFLVDGREFRAVAWLVFRVRDVGEVVGKFTNEEVRGKGFGVSLCVDDGSVEFFCPAK